ETAAAKPAEPPQCATSRANIALLESGNPVQQDTDGDGKRDKTLDDTELANQLDLARALLKANCPDAPAGTKRHCVRPDDTQRVIGCASRMERDVSTAACKLS